MQYLRHVLTALLFLVSSCRAADHAAYAVFLQLSGEPQTLDQSEAANVVAVLSQYLEADASCAVTNQAIQDTSESAYILEADFKCEKENGQQITHDEADTFEADMNASLDQIKSLLVATVPAIELVLNPHSTAHSQPSLPKVDRSVGSSAQSAAKTDITASPAETSATPTTSRATITATPTVSPAKTTATLTTSPSETTADPKETAITEETTPVASPTKTPSSKATEATITEETTAMPAVSPTKTPSSKATDEPANEGPREGNEEISRQIIIDFDLVGGRTEPLSSEERSQLLTDLDRATEESGVEAVHKIVGQEVVDGQLKVQVIAIYSGEAATGETVDKLQLEFAESDFTDVGDETLGHSGATSTSPDSSTDAVFAVSHVVSINIDDGRTNPVLSDEEQQLLLERFQATASEFVSDTTATYEISNQQMVDGEIQVQVTARYTGANSISAAGAVESSIVEDDFSYLVVQSGVNGGTPVVSPAEATNSPTITPTKEPTMMSYGQISGEIVINFDLNKGRTEPLHAEERSQLLADLDAAAAVSSPDLVAVHKIVGQDIVDGQLKVQVVATYSGEEMGEEVLGRVETQLTQTDFTKVGGKTLTTSGATSTVFDSSSGGLLSVNHILNIAVEEGRTDVLSEKEQLNLLGLLETSALESALSTSVSYEITNQVVKNGEILVQVAAKYSGVDSSDSAGAVEVFVARGDFADVLDSSQGDGGLSSKAITTREIVLSFGLGEDRVEPLSRGELSQLAEDLDAAAAASAPSGLVVVHQIVAQEVADGKLKVNVVALYGGEGATSDNIALVHKNLSSTQVTDLGGQALGKPDVAINEQDSFVADVRTVSHVVTVHVDDEGSKRLLTDAEQDRLIELLKIASSESSPDTSTSFKVASQESRPGQIEVEVLAIYAGGTATAEEAVEAFLLQEDLLEIIKGSETMSENRGSVDYRATFDLGEGRTEPLSQEEQAQLLSDFAKVAADQSPDGSTPMEFEIISQQIIGGQLQVHVRTLYNNPDELTVATSLGDSLLDGGYTEVGGDSLRSDGVAVLSVQNMLDRPEDPLLVTYKFNFDLLENRTDLLSEQEKNELLEDLEELATEVSPGEDVSFEIVDQQIVDGALQVQVATVFSGDNSTVVAYSIESALAKGSVTDVGGETLQNTRLKGLSVDYLLEFSLENNRTEPLDEMEKDVLMGNMNALVSNDVNATFAIVDQRIRDDILQVEIQSTFEDSELMEVARSFEEAIDSANMTNVGGDSLEFIDVTRGGLSPEPATSSPVMIPGGDGPSRVAEYRIELELIDGRESILNGTEQLALVTAVESAAGDSVKSDCSVVDQSVEGSDLIVNVDCIHSSEEESLLETVPDTVVESTESQSLLDQIPNARVDKVEAITEDSGKTKRRFSWREISSIVIGALAGALCCCCCVFGLYRGRREASEREKEEEQAQEMPIGSEPV